MQSTDFRFAPQLVLVATSLCLASCQTSGPLSAPSGLPDNPNIQINDLVVNQERESWLAQPLGTSVKYKGSVSFRNNALGQELGSYQARLADVELDVTRVAVTRVLGGGSPVTESATINGTPVQTLTTRGGWDEYGLLNEKVKIASRFGFPDSPSAPMWVPRGGSAWSKKYLVSSNSKAQANGVKFVESFETTVTYEPKNRDVTTPAGKFLCDRICVTTVACLDTDGPVRPGFQRRVSYTPLKGEYLVSAEVPGLVVQYNFTEWNADLRYLLLHKNSHLTGQVYPNAAVHAEKPNSSGFFRIEKITRP